MSFEGLRKEREERNRKRYDVNPKQQGKGWVKEGERHRNRKRKGREEGKGKIKKGKKKGKERELADVRA